MKATRCRLQTYQYNLLNQRVGITCETKPLALITSLNPASGVNPTTWLNNSVDCSHGKRSIVHTSQSTDHAENKLG